MKTVVFYLNHILYCSQQHTSPLRKSSSSSTPTSPSSSIPSSPRKNHSYETPPTSPKFGRGTSPHFDKRFFEAGLIEMKSQASSTSTLDDSSTDDVWVKRIDPKDIARHKKVSSSFISENNSRRLYLLSTLLRYIIRVCNMSCSLRRCR